MTFGGKIATSKEYAGAEGSAPARMSADPEKSGYFVNPTCTGIVWLGLPLAS
jgi:hypothetical protein